MTVIGVIVWFNRLAKEKPLFKSNRKSHLSSQTFLPLSCLFLDVSVPAHTGDNVKIFQNRNPLKSSQKTAGTKLRYDEAQQQVFDAVGKCNLLPFVEMLTPRPLPLVWGCHWLEEAGQKLIPSIAIGRTTRQSLSLSHLLKLPLR